MKQPKTERNLNCEECLSINLSITSQEWVYCADCELKRAKEGIILI